MRLAYIIAVSVAFLCAACEQDMDKAKKKAKDDDKDEAGAKIDTAEVDAGAPADDAGATDAAAIDAGAGDAAEIDGGEAGEGDADADGDGGDVAGGKDLDADIRSLKDDSTKFFVKKDDGEFIDVTEVPDGICNDGDTTELELKASSDAVDDAELGDSDMLSAKQIDDDTVEVMFESDGTLGFILDNKPDDEKLTLTCPDGLSLKGM